VREVARNGEWRTTVRFFKEIAEQQQTEGQHMLVAELARELGRRDLGVIVGQAAEARGFLDFQHIAFPLIPVPPGTEQSWTMIHAIARQESQFAQNAMSHVGARGLMQLMPATANEQATKLGLSYSTSALTDDAGYNLMVGSAFFGRLMDIYGGSTPLAVAAYNAGPGNVNKWLRANGDPRTGAVEWVDWIERIPLSETQLCPARARKRRRLRGDEPRQGELARPQPDEPHPGQATAGVRNASSVSPPGCHLPASGEDQRPGPPRSRGGGPPAQRVVEGKTPPKGCNSPSPPPPPPLRQRA
jgi:hypothetical protein